MRPETLALRHFKENKNPIVIFYKESQLICEINLSAENLIGLKRDEVIEKDIADIYDQENYTRIMRRIEKGIDEGVIELLRITNIYGDEINFGAKFQEIEYDNKKCVAVEMIQLSELENISDFKTNYLISLIDSIPNPFLIIDFSEVLKKLSELNLSTISHISNLIDSNYNQVSKILNEIQIIHANSAVYELYEIEDANSCETKIHDFLISLDKERLIKFFTLLIKKEQEYFTNTIDTKMNGSLFYAQVYLRVLKEYEKTMERVLVQINDITDYRKAEDSIKRLENRYNTLFNSSEIGIAIISIEQRLININEALTEMSGFSYNELVGMKIREFVKSPAREELEKKIGEVFENKKVYIKEELPIDLNDDQNRWWKFTVSLIKEETGKPNFGIALIEDISEQKKLDFEREKLFEEVSSARKRLELLTKFLLAAQETERGNISRELHDEVGQVLTAINIELQSILKLSPSKKIKAHISEGISLVDYAIKKAKNLSINLRPSILDDLGLIAAVRWFLKKEEERADLNIEFAANVTTRRFKSEIEVTCYRIIQESITNILRHAEAQNVKVSIDEKQDELLLEISDDGIGFDENELNLRAKEGKSMGLLSMMERVELVGGTIKIQSHIKESGTIISARIPKIYYVKKL